MKEVLALCAAFLALIGNVPYVYDCVKGDVRPHPYTWFVGAVVSAITLLGMYTKGAGYGALPVLVSEFFTILIFLLSIRHGFKATRTMDHVFLSIALLSVVPWYLTHDPTLSVCVAVGIDVLAFAPALRKAYAFPRTEDRLLYGTNIFRHILTLFALQSYSVVTMLHSIAMIGINALMSFILWQRRGL